MNTFNTHTISEIYSIEKVIAIDPGANGGIVISSPNEDLQVLKMVTTKEFSDLLRYELTKTENILVVIEKVQMWNTDSDSPGKQFGIDKMMKNYNSLIAACQINDVAYWEVHPLTWQKGLYFNHKGLTKQERKNKYKEFAQKQFPDIKTTLWNADALCISKYINNQIAHNFSWLLKQLDKNMLHNIRVYN